MCPRHQAADAVQFIPVARPLPKIAPGGNHVSISWLGSGTLQSANQVNGPYAPVIDAPNPYPDTVKSNQTKFFRVMQ